MRPPLTATAPFSITSREPFIVTTVPPLIIKSTIVFLRCASADETALKTTSNSRIRMTPRFLSDLRVSVVIFDVETRNHGDTENTERKRVIIISLDPLLLEIARRKRGVKDR